MNTDEPVRIGIVGAGNFGTLHALTVSGLAEARLAGVVGRRPEPLERLRQSLPQTPMWTDLNRALAESGAQAWVVASATASHVSVARAILESGRPVLVEKPIAESLNDAQSLASLVRPDSSNLMMGHILLFNSEFRQLQDEIRQRGPISFLNSVRHRPIITMDAHPGEGPLGLLMVHDLYVSLALLGRAEPLLFHARLHRNRQRNVPDLAVAELQWPDGTIGSYAASFLTPGGMAADGFDRLEVFGQDWVARISPNPRPIEIWDDRARWPMALEIRADPLAPSGMLAEELRCFCRVVRGLEPVPIGATYHDAIQVQRWLDKLEKSALEGPDHG
jgi:predicted dehydrogenase